jgi:hypothetical protein
MSKVTRRPVKPHFYTEGLEIETRIGVPEVFLA